MTFRRTFLHPLTRHEIFGPLAPVVAAACTEEAVAMANDSEYGLISYVDAPDVGQGLKVGRQVNLGLVTVNRGFGVRPGGAVPRDEAARPGEGDFAGIHGFLEAQYLALDC